MNLVKIILPFLIADFFIFNFSGFMVASHYERYLIILAYVIKFIIIEFTIILVVLILEILVKIKKLNLRRLSLYDQQRIEREEKNNYYKGKKKFQNYSEISDGNFPVSGQGDRRKGNAKGRNLGSRRGQKGGRYNYRVSKNGKRYRQYY